MQGTSNLVYPICAPAAVRLDAETGLSPIPDIGQQPYEHVANPDPSPDAEADVGSGPMGRCRTTSLSNPLFEQVGAVPSHMTSHDSMPGADEAPVERDGGPSSAGASGLQEPFPAVVPSEASVAEPSSPLTGVHCFVAYEFVRLYVCLSVCLQMSASSVVGISLHIVVLFHRDAESVT